MIQAHLPIYVLYNTGVIKEILCKLIVDENGVLQSFTIPEQPTAYLILVYSSYLLVDGLLVEMSEFIGSNNIDQNIDTLIFDFLTAAEKTISSHTWFGNVLTSTLIKDESLFRTNLESQDIYRFTEPPVTVVASSWGVQFVSPFDPLQPLYGNGHLALSDAQKDFYFYLVESLSDGTFRVPEDKQNFNFNVAHSLPTNFLIFDNRHFQLDYRNNTPDTFSGQIQITNVVVGGVESFTIDFNR